VTLSISRNGTGSNPLFDATYDFSKLPDALDHLDRAPFGKVVVEVR
jgi:hypothetical protein